MNCIKINENEGLLTIQKQNGNKYRVLFDLEDLPKIAARTWHISHKNYAKTVINGKHTNMSSYVLGISTDYYKMVDHINGDRLDNRKSNLKIVNPSDNMRNKSVSSGNTGIVGIYYWDKKDIYRVRDRITGKHRGCRTLEEALMIELINRLSLHGDLDAALLSLGVEVDSEVDLEALKAMLYVMHIGQLHRVQRQCQCQ